MSRPQLRSAIASCVAGLLLLSPCTAQDAVKHEAQGKQNSIAVSEMRAYQGLFNFFWDEQKGTIWLQIDRFQEPFLYVTSLAAGLGS